MCEETPFLDSQLERLSRSKCTQLHRQNQESKISCLGIEAGMGGGMIVEIYALEQR